MHSFVVRQDATASTKLKMRWQKYGCASRSVWYRISLVPGSGSASASNKNPDPHPDLHQINIRIQIRIRIRIKVINWIRIRISFQMTSQIVWNMKLFEHFFKGLKARICIQIRIHIRMKSRIRIKIRICIK